MRTDPSAEFSYDGTMPNVPVGGGGGAERRAHARFDIHLPVKLTVVASPPVDRASGRLRAASSGSSTSSSTAARSTESVLLFALALDVSERGMKIEVAGLSTKFFRDASDPLVRLEVAFTHPRLGHIGTRGGYVRWRRTGKDPHTLALGAWFDGSFTAAELSRIVECGTELPVGKKHPWATVALGIATTLLGVGWYRSHADDVRRDGGNMHRLVDTENALADTQANLERCYAVQAARTQVTTAAAAWRVDLDRTTDAGQDAGSDAGADSMADAGSGEAAPESGH